MTEQKRDELIIEMHTDIRWLKEQHKEHMASHAKYIYYMITIAVGLVISWFR